MDANTKDVLLAAIGALGGLLTGVVVSVLGIRYARKSDDAAWTRQDLIRRDELERARAERWLDRRREVAVTVAGVATAIKQMALAHRAGKALDVEAYFLSLERGFAAVAELRLISEDLAGPGGDLLITANELAILASTNRRADLEPKSDEVDEALGTFMTAAEHDLKS